MESHESQENVSEGRPVEVAEEDRGPQNQPRKSSGGTRTKTSKLESNRRWWVRHREALNEKKRQYCLANPERVKAKNAAYYVKNREIVKERVRQYSQKNSDAIKARERILHRQQLAAETPEQRERRRAYHREWARVDRAKNPEKYHSKIRKRRAEDPQFVMMCRLRCRLSDALRVVNSTKSATTIQLLGCTPDFLMKHIESLFSKGMTWDNRKLWHLDHIRPLVQFDLLDPAQQRECFHYTNLRPIWWFENLEKRRQDCGWA